ncbi:MAG: histone deacetylase, partial [Candidatus Thermoplasmatota archaeon]|nr:histone deacetylase [Candidatus Thermoplasmatota archaeon]
RRTMASPRVSLIYSEDHVIHRPATSSPENPERLLRVIRYIKNKSEITGKEVTWSNVFPPATEEDILRAHQQGYVNFVKNYCARGGGFLGDSTYFTPGSYEAALCAAGGAIKATEMVLEGSTDMSFALVRPPGHHAKSDNYGGFCIFNNVAVAIRKFQALKKMGKVMIVDWDAHAGNGTMEIFYEDPSVLLVSLHCDPKNFYPSDGFAHQIGKGKGRGTTVNVEMPIGSGDDEYKLAMEEIVKPLYKQWKPDLLFSCIGFDSHFSEELTTMNLTSQGYHQIVSTLTELSERRMVMTLEGGYNWYNPRLTHTVINALVGRPAPYTDDVDILSSSIVREKKVNKVMRQKIASLKELLSDYYKWE